MKVKSKKLKVKNMNFIQWAFTFCLLPFSFALVQAQEQPPEPTSPRAVKVPTITEGKLPNGMKIVVVQRNAVPLVTVNLLINSGANIESKDGLADMTASLLTKGTKNRSATAIAEQMEFLGSSINSGAGWNSTNVSFTATSDKLDKAMAIMSDVVLNPTFPADEIKLYKSQTIDDLSVELKQPGRLANYVAARYSFGEHSVAGTPETIEAITQKEIQATYRDVYKPKSATLIFTGDINLTQAIAIAKKYFGLWKNPVEPNKTMLGRPAVAESANIPLFRRMLVVDLPKSGQAAVIYTKKVEFGRSASDYFPASVANSLLGGGYSSRLNQEIRIKRGLSYGAGSSFAWRSDNANFSTRCQTKTVSAAEVAELTVKEIQRLTGESAPEVELTPRKNVLNGNFGRIFETNAGISNAISELLTFGLPTTELNSFMSNTEKITPQQVKEFSANNLRGGDIIIVGDYNDFKADLAKRFPNQQIEVIKADDLDLNSETLRKK